LKKPTYRQSNIANYFECPHRFHLSRHHDMPTSDAMEEGRLFEAIVLGAKDEEEKKALFGRKTKKTIDSYTRSADMVRQLFDLADIGVGLDSYVTMVWESEEYILQGEADFIGYLRIYGKRYKSIADLKFTGSITRVWMDKTRKSQFLQSAVYQYLHYMNSGELLPFTYIVVENLKSLPMGAKPIIKIYIIKPNMEALNWVESLVQAIHEDSDLRPNLEVCEDGPFKSRCKYLIHCAHGRKLIETPVEVDFMSLME